MNGSDPAPARASDPAGAPSPAPAPVPGPAAVAARDPLHGMTLEAIVGALVECYGWAGLGSRIPLRCFTHEPSVASSLKFLRRTPWAREKVEGLYRFMLRDDARRRRAGAAAPAAPR